MKNKLVIGLLVMFLLSMPMACAKETPAQNPQSPTEVPVEPASGTPGAANDDIVYPPGGFTYRANVHQQGERDWPAVQQTEVTLEALSGTIDIQYRDYIETKAGETRNNIIFLNGRNAPELLDPLQVYYRAVDLPDGITIERDRQMYGGIGGQDRKSSRVVLLIHIASQVKPGEYPFAIHLEYEGRDLGGIPCTIKVSAPQPAAVPEPTPPPITSPPPPRTDWEQGSPPPEGIEGLKQPEPLTGDEKAQVVEIGLSSQGVSEWLQGRTDYRTGPIEWYAIIWNSNGEAGTWWSLGYDRIANEGIPDFVSPYALWYPGVTIAVGEGTIYQMQIAVDLDTEKTAMVMGPYPSLSSPGRFKNIPAP